MSPRRVLNGRTLQAEAPRLDGQGGVVIHTIV